MRAGETCASCGGDEGGVIDGLCYPCRQDRARIEPKQLRFQDREYPERAVPPECVKAPPHGGRLAVRTYPILFLCEDHLRADPMRVEQDEDWIYADGPRGP